LFGGLKDRDEVLSSCCDFPEPCSGSCILFLNALPLLSPSPVLERWDRVTTTTKRPGVTRAPAKPAGSDFDLADALDGNDQDDGRRKPSPGGGGFSDKDLEDILGGGEYRPDKGKGDAGYGSNGDSESGMSAETGTIAGVASALAMALIGAVSSYISYQQKKFCFSIQQGLNADYVKGENLEAVVCEEPQGEPLEVAVPAGSLPAAGASTEQNRAAQAVGVPAPCPDQPDSRDAGPTGGAVWGLGHTVVPSL
uniref:CD99 antigen-like protein 2 n=1 Tax=Sus scrofa TaxID=9823 RepID=A0A8D1N8E7_PIG